MIAFYAMIIIALAFASMNRIHTQTPVVEEGAEKYNACRGLTVVNEIITCIHQIDNLS
jgi:hypothetical protein